MQPQAPTGNIAQGLDPTAVTLTRAIRQVESGGNYQAKGASGEFGAYQWMPGHFQNAAQTYLGDSNAQMTPQNQDKVAYFQIKGLLDKGYTQSQVASMWNSGSPNWQGKVGTNSFGVKYDVPAYVNNVKSAYQSLLQGQSASQFTKPQPGGPDATDTPSTQQGGGLLQNLVDYGLPILGTVAGGVIGATAGAPAFGIGALAGGTAGAAVGAAGGQGWAEAIDQLMGWRKYTPLQAGVQPLLTGAATAASGGASEALAPFTGLGGVAARVGAQGVIGSTFGASQAALQGSDIGKGAALGSLFGAGAQTLGEGVNSLVGQSQAGGLPQQLAEEALPKQSASDKARDITQTIINLPGLNVGSKLDAAQGGIDTMQSQIEPLLAQGDAVARAGPAISGEQISQDVLQNYPNSGWDADTIKSRLLRVVPQQTSLVNKLFSDEGLNFTEADTLKKALYANSAVSRAFRNMTDPRLLADKGLASDTSIALANAIKGGLSDTQIAGLYSQQTKYISARNLLDRLDNMKGSKTLSFPSLLTLLGGSAIGGPHVGIPAAILERLSESPGVKLGAASALNRLGQSSAFQGAQTISLPARIQILQALLNSQSQTQ